MRLSGAAAIASSSLLASAANMTWNGGGAADNSWLTGLNWIGGVAPSATDSLIFAGTTSLSPVNNFTAGTQFNGITFAAAAGAFTLSGNAITIGQASGITNNSTNAQTIGLPVTFAGGHHRIVTAASSGALSFTNSFIHAPHSTVLFTRLGGAIHFDAGVGPTNDGSDGGGILGAWATFQAAQGANVSGASDYASDWATRDVNGNIVAYTGYAPTVNSGGSLNSSATANAKVTSNGAGSITLGGAPANNTWDLNTLLFTGGSANQTIDIGTGRTLRLGADGGILNGSPLNGTTVGTVRSLTIGNTAGQGILTAGGAPNTPGTLTLIDGPISANTANNLNINAVIADNGANGTVSVNVQGYVNMATANTYTGGTYITTGRVQASAGAFGTGSVVVNQNGHIFLNANATFTNDFYIRGFGSPESGGIGAIRMGGTGRIISGNITLEGTAATGNGTVTGRIFGPASATLYVGSGTANGSGTFQVGSSDGANDYHGDTYINNNPTVSGGGGIPNASNVLSFNAGRNEVMPHGAGYGNVVLNGVSATIFAGLDLNGTTQTINGLSNTTAFPASANVFNRNTGAAGTLNLGDNNYTGTYAGRFTAGSTVDQTGGGGVLNINKIGNGVLTLTGANTHTGLTIVSAGTLALSSASNNIPNSPVLVNPGGALNLSGVTGVFSPANNQTVTNNGNVYGAVNATAGTVGGNGGTYNNGITVAGGTVNPGNPGGTGSFTTTTLALNSGTLLFDFSGSNSDAINVTGAANFTGGAIGFNLLTPAVAGSYTILTAGAITGTPTPAVSTLGRTTFTLDLSTANTVKVNVTGGPASLVWNNTGGPGNGTDWDTTQQNWLNGAANDKFFTLDNVTFDDNNNGHYAVNITTSVNPSSIVVNNSAGDYTFSGSPITGTGGLVKNGTGALTVSTANTFSGGVTLNAGQLNINSDSALGSGTFTIAGGTINVTSGDRAIAGNIAQRWNGDVNFLGTANLNMGGGSVTLNANPTINVASNTLTVGGVIVDGTGNSITKTGPGTLALNGASTYTGNFTVSAGTVMPGSSGAFGSTTSAGSVTVASGAVIDLANAGSQSLNFGQKPFYIVGAGTNNSGVLTSSDSAKRQQNVFQRVILTGDATIGGNGSFDIRAANVGGVNQGLLDLAGNNLTWINTQHGLINIDVTDGNMNVTSGTLQIEANTSIASLSASKTVTMNNSWLQFFGYAGTFTRPIVVNSGVTFATNNNATSTVGANVTLNDNLNVTAAAGAGTVSTLVLNGNISESGGARQINKSNGSAGTLNLVLGGNNTFTGGLNVNGGTVTLANPGALNAANPNTVNLGGTNAALRINGNSVAISGLTGSNTSIVENANAAAATLTYSSNSDAQFDGAMRDGAGGGAFGFTKAGTGTFRLNGANTYTGATTISGGSLSIGTGGTTGSIATTSAIAGSGNLVLNRSDNTTFANVIGGSVNLIKESGNTVTLSGASTSTGAATINNGVLSVTGSLPAAGTVNINGGATLAGTGNGTSSGIVGRVNMNGSSNVRPGVTAADGDFGSLAMNSLLVTNGSNEFRLDQTSPAVGDRVNVSGVASFSAGSSTTFTPVFSGAPSQGDYVLLSAGNLQVGAGATLNLTSPASSSTRLAFSLSTSIVPNAVVMHVVGNAKSLVWTGSADATTWDVNNLTNWKDGVTSGVEKYFDLDSVTFDDTSANHNITLNQTVSPGAVTVDTASTYTIGGSGHISGIADLIKTGSGTLVLNLSNNTYGGDTLVQNGTLKLGANQALPSASSNVVLGSGSNSGVLDVNGFSGTFSGLSTSGTGTGNVLTNGGASDVTITYTGAGSNAFAGQITDGPTNKISLALNTGASLVLAGDSTYTGQTTIQNNSTLQLGNGGTAGNIGGGAVQNDGALVFNRSDTVTFNAAINGGGQLQAIGTGTAILTANNTYGGVTTVGSLSSLQVGAGTTSGSLGTGNLVANGTVVFNHSDDISIGNTVSGTGNIVKNGAGSMTLTGTNTYSGRTIVNSGTMGVAATGNLGTSSVIINSGGAFDTKGVNLSAHAFTIAGTGVSGSGAIFNNGASQTTTVAGLTLSADATIKADDFGQGGTFGRWDIRSGSAVLDLAGHTLTKIGNQQFSIVAGSVTAGTIEVNAGNFAIQTTTVAQAAGQITVNSSVGGTMLTFWQNAAGNVTMPIRINGEGNIMGNAASGAASLATVSSPITLNGNLILSNQIPNNPSTAPFTLAGPISEVGGPRGIIKQGNFLATLSGASTYTGNTTVSEGTLALNTGTTGNTNNIPNSAIISVANGANLDVTGVATNTFALASASSQTLVNNGTVYGAVTVPNATTVKGTGSFAGNVSVTGGGHVAAGNSVGQINFSALSLNAANLDIEADNSGADRIIVNTADGLTLSGVSLFNFTNLGGLTTGTYTLLDYSGTALANLSNFAVGSIAPGFSFTLVNNTSNTSVDVNVGTSVISNSTWNVDASGNWSASGNWIGGVPNSVDATANFGTVITAPRTVTVDSAQTVGTMNFSSPNSYTLAGSNAITLDVAAGNAAINVTAGSHTISAPVTLNDNVTITSNAGSGIALTGALSATGKTITKAGTGSVQFENVRAAALNVSAGSAKISAKGSANSASGTSVVQSLAIASGASLDLTNNSAVVDYTGPVGTLVGDVRQHLQSGRLTTSLGDANHKLGYGDNAVMNKATFAGQTVDTSSILIKFTYAGDANLDGQVDVTDLGALATNWQTSNVWTGGDFNYDGFVDVTDLGALATNWQAGVGSPLGPGSLESAMAAVGLGSAAVPEPGSVGLLGLALTASIARRRRRRA